MTLDSKSNSGIPSNPSSGNRYAIVLLEAAIRQPLDYAIPEMLSEKVARGTLVEVPLRKQTARGFVLGTKTNSDVPNVRPILRCISEEAPLTDALFELALWIAKYYICPLGRVLRTMLPLGVRKATKTKEPYYVERARSRKELQDACAQLITRAPQQAALLQELLPVRGGMLLSELLEATGASPSSVKALVDKSLITLKRVRQEDILAHAEYFKTTPKTLRGEQLFALDSIAETISTHRFGAHLLFGVTGSGKTEVYLQAIEKAIQHNLSTIMLVPEIALTAQTIQRFKSRFDRPIAVLHHRLADGERAVAWEQMRKGAVSIVIGARSAIFSPMPRLGLIIVDEEHEQSYKQSDDLPCYSARDVAVMRAKLEHACVVLGSATPSLESYQNAITGKYVLNTLSARPDSASLPTVSIVDMKREYEKAKGFTSFSEPLLSGIQQRKEKGEHTILFLNRRGYHTILSCQSCAKTVSCPHCEASLTFHLGDNIAACHLCGFSVPPPKSCPTCKSPQLLQYRGVGTEKIQAMLHAIFPDIRTLRIDADSTRHKGTLERLLHEFRTGKADVMIGTQMVAKGLHFPQVTLVGVLNVDTSLNIPDFRAQESVFQLITQVAGRAGRSLLPGEVIIQTALPEQSTIQLASQQDYDRFFQEEIAVRKLFGFPPFCHMVKIVLSGKDAQKTERWAHDFAEHLGSTLPAPFICHPLVPAGHKKIKNYFRFQLLIRGPAVTPIAKAIEASDKVLPPPSGLLRHIDVDPLSTFF